MISPDTSDCRRRTACRLIRAGLAIISLGLGMGAARSTAAETIVAVPPSVLSFGAYATGTACGAITMSGGAYVDSFDSSHGTYGQTKTLSQGIVGVSGNISLSGQSTIYGQIFALNTNVGTCQNGVPGITISGQAKATGGYIRLAAAPPFPTPIAATPGSQDYDLTADLTLPPGSYRNITVSGRHTLTFSAGTYNINSLTLSGQSALALAPPGQVVVNVAGNNVAQPLNLSGGTVSNLSAIPLNFQLIYAGSQPITLSGGSASYGLVYAPNAAATLSGGGDWYGAITVKTLNDSGGGAIHYDRSLIVLPTITATVTPQPNANGWNNTNVTVTFVCLAPLGIANCPAPITVTTEGRNQVVSGIGLDNAGNSATTSVSVNIDKTLPVVTASQSPVANANGWNNSPVTVTFAATDALSGVVPGSLTAPVALSVDGGGQSASGHATDLAGNIGTVTRSGVNIDQTVPSTSVTVSPPPNANGWNNTSVTAHFSCSDAGSGIATCPPDQIVSSEAANQTVTGTATDRAGNTSTATTTVSIDKTPPAVQFTSPANNSSTPTTPITVQGSFSGGGSPITSATCNGTAAAISGLAFTCAVPLPTTGVNRITAAVTDAAGNTGTAALNVNYQPSVPTITGAISPAPNAAGWNNTNVTITFTCTNATTCQAPISVSTEGANQVFQGNATGPGGTAATQVTVNIDKTAPVVQLTSPANNSSSSTSPISVQGSFSAGGSPVTAATCNGVAATISNLAFTCTVPLLAGANQISVAVTDAAGNAGTAALTVNYQPSGGPTIAGAISPAPNAAGWNNTNVTITFTCTNATTCQAPITVSTEGGNQVFQGTATGAGGTATTQVTVNLDKTAPVVQFTSPANNSSTPTTPITVQGSFSAGGSPATAATCNGVAATISNLAFTCTVPLPTIGANQISAAVTDVAGNTGTAALNVNYQPSGGPTITGAVSPAPNAAGWNNTNVTITFTCTNATTCQAPITVSTEGANQVFQGTATGAGGTATTQVTVNIDKTPPVEAFTVAPPATIAPGNTAVLSVNASDNIGVVTVAFSVDGAVISTRTIAPFDFSFAIPAGAAVGATRVFAVEARDAAGNSTVLSQPVLVTQPSQLTLNVDPPVSPTFQSSEVLTGLVGKAVGGTTLTIAGGASAATQRLPNAQTQFGLRVPLKPNAQNTLTVTATDDSGQTASVGNLNVLQVTLSSVVTAQVTAQRLTTPEVQALVASGTINIGDPANYNVSVFSIALTVGGRQAPVTVTVPVIKPVGQPLGLGPAITIICQQPGGDIEETANAILIPCDDNGGGGNLRHDPPAEVIPFEIDMPDAPAGTPSVPGIILIDGKIKTLKEFFKVNLLLMNVSSAFTLTGITAKLTVPDNGLSPVAPASAAITMDDLAAGTQGTGQFIIRGDIIGVHTVTVNFGASLTSPLLSSAIPISGSASTNVEVKGPPTLNVTVEHPDSVTAGVPYTLKVNVKNTSADLDALFTSLELDLAGADLIDPTTGLPSTGPSIASLGDILAGQSASQSYTVLPHDTGPITSCVAGATANITLSVVFTNNSSLGCAVGTLPSQMVGPSGQPTVTVLPRQTRPMFPSGRSSLCSFPTRYRRRP